MIPQRPGGSQSSAQSRVESAPRIALGGARGVTLCARAKGHTHPERDHRAFAVRVGEILKSQLASHFL